MNDGPNTAMGVPLRDGAEDPSLEAIFAEVQTAIGEVPNLYRGIGHSPVLLRSWIDYAWSLRADPVADRGLRELVILRVASLSGADYCWRSHWRAARHAGYPASKLLALSNWVPSSEFSESERAVLALTDTMVAGSPTDPEVWQSVVNTFGYEQAVELVLTVGWYVGVVRVVPTLGIPLEDGHDRAPAVPSPSPDADLGPT